MRRIPATLLVGGLAATLAGCGSADGHGGRAPDLTNFAPGPTPAEHAAGERLFAASCARCHGERAVGTPQGPPLLHPYYEPGHHGDEAFRRAVALGVTPHHWRFGPMPAITGVSREQTDSVIGYVRWMQRRAGIGGP